MRNTARVTARASIGVRLAVGAGGVAGVGHEFGWHPPEAQHRRAVDYLLGVLETQGGRSAARFWEVVEDRCPGLLPEREARSQRYQLRRLLTVQEGQLKQSDRLNCLGSR